MGGLDPEKLVGDATRGGWKGVSFPPKARQASHRSNIIPVRQHRHNIYLALLLPGVSRELAVRYMCDAVCR